jgi:hypothetical protein
MNAIYCSHLVGFWILLEKFSRLDIAGMVPKFAADQNHVAHELAHLAKRLCVSSK